MKRPRNTITAAATVLVAAAVFTPAPARAGNVLLWACHGPRGKPLGATPFHPVKGGDGVTDEYDGGCGKEGTGGLSATFSQADPEGGSLASWQLAVPEGVTLDSVRIARTLNGFSGEPVTDDPQSYEAGTSTMSLESASLEGGLPPPGELFAAPAEGRFVRVSVGCKLPTINDCAPPLGGGTVGVDTSSVTLGVLDDTPPTGAVGGVQSPAAGTLGLRLNATDTGLGLANAEASLEGGASTFVRLGTGACPEHPSPAASIEMPLDAACPKELSEIALPLDTTSVPDGEHTLRVSVTDAAGNTTTLVDQPITVQNNKPATGTTATVTIGIASGSSGATAPAPAGGVLGSFSSTTPGGEPVACQLPVLSMRLTSKPLRYTKSGKRRIPVLRSRHHYVFKGHLTCLLHNRRISAPTGIVLRALYTIKAGHHYRTYASGRGTMTVHNGNLRAILAYYNSRTIIFRYKPGNGEFAQVKLPIEVVRSRAKRRPGAR